MIITCNLCGSSNIHDWFTMKSDQVYVSGKKQANEYTICRCEDCELVFVKEIPTPEELQDIYSEGYYTGRDKMGYSNYAEKYEKAGFFEKTRRRLRGALGRPKNWANLEYSLRRHTFNGSNKSKDMTFINRCSTSQGNLLDVGCAMGSFLSTAKDDGWTVEGVELSEYGSQHTRKTLSINVFNGSLGDAVQSGSIKESFFDVVTLWDTLEHLTDPAVVFRDVNYALKEGGWFFFSTVNIDSLLAKREGEGWHFFRPPKHLYYYSEKTLKDYLHRYGFSIGADEDFRKDLIVVGARKDRSL